jgi:tripartite-type tricarboxylate transporter receptor subunit TctC
MMMLPSKLCVGALASLAWLVAQPLVPARADGYPSRTVSIVVPLGAGGAMDNIARLIADKLSHKLHGTVIIENKPGGGMVIGAVAVKTAAPDGYTLMDAPSGAYAINPTLYKKLSYNPETDYVPVALYAHLPFVLVVNAKLPIHSVKELIGYAKAHPGKLSYAASGFGGVIHLAGEILKRDTGIKMVSVPYSHGGPAALFDVVAGNVQFTFADPSLVAGQLKTHKIRALAVSSAERMPMFPNLPTVAEAGIAGFDAVSWHLIVAPAKTPGPIVEKLHNAIKAIIAEPDVHAHMLKLGMIPVDTPSVAQLRKFLASEDKRWGDIIRSAGLAGKK